MQRADAGQRANGPALRRPARRTAPTARRGARRRCRPPRAPARRPGLKEGESNHAHYDSGHLRLPNPAVYVPVDSSFEAGATLVRAALRQPGQRIAALPGGELAVRKVLDRQLQSGGQSLAVALYAVIGIDTRPDFIWLTGPEDHRFFALVIPGLARVIEQGWEGQGAELERLQVQAEPDWLHELAGRLAHRLADPIVIRNVRVFDSQN